MTGRWSELLKSVTRVPGVRGAMVVSAEDGLVVAESSMQGVDGAAVAALTAGLAARMGRTVAALGHPEPAVIHLEAESGAILAAPGADGLLLAAVADPDVNVGMLRLALRDAAGRLG